MAFFEKFPYINYTFPDSYKRAYKNISLRPNVIAEFLTDGSNLEEYIVGEGETPEIIAFEQYDNVDMHWVILMANNIMNLYTDWPKGTYQFNEYLLEKYRTQIDSDGNTVDMSDAETQEFIEFEGTTTNSFMSTNSANVVMKPHHFEDDNGRVYSWATAIGDAVDARGREIVQPTLTPKSIYDYEFDLNEAKRVIVIPSKDTALQMTRELGKLLNE